MTDSQSTSLSWCQAPIWDLGPVTNFSFPLKFVSDSCRFVIL
jgi:hypothetical protein